MRKNLFKLILFLAISIVHGLSVLAQPPVDPNGDNGADLTPYDPRQNCLDRVTLTGNYNDNTRGFPALFVIAECPGSTQFTLTLPECEICDEPYEVEFNGEEVTLYKNGVVKPNFLTGQYPSGRYTFNLDSRHLTESTGILKVGFDCSWLSSQNISQEFRIKIISEGTKIDVPVPNEPPRSFCNILEPVETTSLCNCGKLESVDELTITGSSTYTTIEESKPIEVTFTGVISPKELPFSFEISLLYPFESITYSNTISNSQQISSTLSSNSLPLGKCINVCYKECHLIRKYETLMAYCETEDLSLGISEKWVPGSESLKLAACAKEFNANENLCPTLFFKLKSKPKLYASEACSGSIEAEILSGSTDLNYYWTGPDGFISKSTSLDNVPAGQYTLTLTDECCNSVSETFFLCSDGVQVSPWAYKAESQEWCADFNCGEPTGTRSSCNLTRCVKADRIDLFFENGFCKERHFFEGTELGVAEENTKEAIREVEYDASSRNCIYKYYCEDDEINPAEVKEESPTSMQWNYEGFSNKCLLDVVCEDVDFENVEEVNPEITYEWDDFYNECVANFVLCDGNEVNQLINTFPDYFDKWEYATFPNYCFRSVTCDNGDVLTDYGEYSEVLIPNPNPDPDCPFSSLIEVYCDGSYVETFDPCVAFNNHQVETRENNKTISFEKSDSGILIKFSNPSDKRVIQINNIDTKVILSKPMEKSASEIYLDTTEFPSGMYIISIRNHTVNEGNYKFIIVK